MNINNVIDEINYNLLSQAALAGGFGRFGKS
jgi:hypothetical protein